MNSQNIDYPVATSPRKKFHIPVLLIGVLFAGLIVSGVIYYFVTHWPPSALQQIESGFIYLRASSTEGQVITEVIVSSSNGSAKKVIQTIPNYIPEEYSGKNYDVAEERGLVVYKITREKTPGVAEASLWISDRGKKPKKILTPSEGRFFQDVIISSDGEKIAYSLIHQGEDLPPELWTVKPDGSENKMLVERLEREYGTNFQLLGFTRDNEAVFLQPLDFDVDTSSDIFTANLRTGKIDEFADITQFIPEGEDGIVDDISFSPDGTKIAFSVFSYKEFEDIHQNNAIIYVRDLNANTTKSLYPASVGVGDYGSVSIRDILWSYGGKKLLYLVEVFMPEIKVIDVRSERLEPVVLVKAPAESVDIFIRPLGWVSEDRIAYIEDRSIAPNSSEFRTILYTIKTDGLDRKPIDSAAYRSEILDPFLLLGSFSRETND